MSFFIHNTKFKTDDVLDNVFNRIKKIDDQDIKNKLDRLYKEKYEVSANQWAKMSGDNRKELEFRKLTCQEIMGNVVMDAFHQELGYQLRPERTILDNACLPSEISKPLLEKNLQNLRSMRKHSVGMKWQQSHKK